MYPFHCFTQILFSKRVNKMADVKTYILKLNEELENEKQNILKHFYVLVKTTDPNIIRRDSDVAHCLKKLDDAEEDILNALYFRNVNLCIKNEIKAFKSIADEDQATLIRIFLKSTLHKPHPADLEHLLTPTKKMNKIYAKIVKICFEKNLMTK